MGVSMEIKVDVKRLGPPSNRGIEIVKVDKRTFEVVVKPRLIPVTIKLSKDIINLLDIACKNRGFSTRSDCIRALIDKFLLGECPCQ